VRDKSGPHGESIGKAQLHVDEQVVAQAPWKTQAGHFTLGGDGICVGFDSEDSVSDQYESPGTFCDGTIRGVAVDISDEVYLDLEHEAAAVMARD